MHPKERAACLDQSLVKARETISPYYDDVFYEVQQRISADGSAGKADVAMLSFWKRLRADTPWVMKLLQWPDADVRTLTRRAVVAARQGDVIEAAGDAREMLRELPGFGQGTALASALLTAAAPDRFAVYDKRARTGPQKIELELPDRGPRFYARYMTLIEQCRAECADAGNRWSAREVELALWVLGGK